MTSGSRSTLLNASNPLSHPSSVASNFDDDSINRFLDKYEDEQKKALQAREVAMWHRINVHVNASKHRQGARKAKRGADNDLKTALELVGTMKTDVSTKLEEAQKLYKEEETICEEEITKKLTIIDDGRVQDRRLVSDIEVLVNEKVQLEVELKQLAQELANNQEAKTTSAELRETQKKEFREEEQQLMQAVEAVESAIKVLSPKGTADESNFLTRQQTIKHRQGLLTTGSPWVAPLIAVQKTLMSAGDISGRAPRQLEALLAHRTDKQAGTNTEEIMGILKTIRNDLKVRLEGARNLEAGNVDKYGALKPSLEDLGESLQEGITEKTAVLADKLSTLASTKEELDALRKSLSAETRSLYALREQCQNKKNSFLQKKASYEEESRVLGEAEKILKKMEEDASAAAASFLQLRMQVHSNGAKHVKKKHLGVESAMKEVVKEIDTMVATLQEKQKREKKAQDRCQLELNGIANAIADNSEKETHLKDAVSRVSLQAETAKAAVDEATQALSDAKMALAEARTQRAEEEADMKATVSAEVKAQKNLEDIMAILDDFYGSKPNPEGDEHGQVLMQMLEKMIEDSENMVKVLAQEDEAAQKAFEVRLKAVIAEKDARESEVRALSLRSAELDENKARLETRVDASKAQGKEMSSYEETLKASCEDLLKNFDDNQEKRSAEIAQLKESKGLFEGYGK